MRWLTIDLVKAHTRIDGNAENSLLELYASAAEDMCLSLMERTEESLYEEFGQIPAPIVQASLMLTEHSYNHRSPASMNNLYTVPYTLEALLKPYMILT